MPKATTEQLSDSLSSPIGFDVVHEFECDGELFAEVRKSDASAENLELVRTLGRIPLVVPDDVTAGVLAPRPDVRVSAEQVTRSAVEAKAKTRLAQWLCAIYRDDKAFEDPHLFEAARW